jgi:hypothetical protein
LPLLLLLSSKCSSFLVRCCRCLRCCSCLSRLQVSEEAAAQCSSLSDVVDDDGALASSIRRTRRSGWHLIRPRRLLKEHPCSTLYIVNGHAVAAGMTLSHGVRLVRVHLAESPSLCRHNIARTVRSTSSKAQHTVRIK